jgi:dTDP-glucose pyrophosphorylase
MLNIVIPISNYSNFPSSDYYPKNLLEIKGKPLIESVYEPISNLDARFIFVVSTQESNIYHTDSVLKIINANFEIILTEGQTQGALATCLLAIKLIDNSDELLILNGDQIIEFEIQKILEHFRKRNLDGGIVSFKSVHPKWSYIKVKNELVTYVQEKKVISNNATAGVYYFKKGSDFIKSAKSIILKRDLVNEKYYVSHSYNELILEGKKIGTFEINKNQLIKLTTPIEIESYLKGGLNG